MNNQIHVLFSKLLADTYALYLKTQNYHWHVTGVNFKSLHLMFEEQYTALATAVDDIAERILAMGKKAPATYSEFQKLSTLKEGDSSKKANEMVKELAQDHEKIIKDLYAALDACQAAHDEGSVALLSDRITAHEKTHWMLKASIE